MPKEEMYLESLRIFRSFGETGYNVAATFKGPHKVELNIGKDLGNKIIGLCMSEIISQIQAAANSVTAQTLLHGPKAAAKEIEHNAQS